ncbi:MAG: sulfotransferase family protein [Anaerolineae bacterium]
MSLKIIGAGFGRTGTTSLKAALEQLGFNKCHHMSEVVKAPSQAVGFLAAYRGEQVDWDQLLSGFAATTDWPACTFYQQLMAHYPDAKVILSVRDPERWYSSAFETIFAIESAIPSWIGRLFPKLGTMRQMVMEMIWQGTFENNFADKPFAIAKFNAHNQAVIDSVPAEKLLVFEVKQGWEPLCQFLDVPVPSTPFPHLNDKKTFKRLILMQKLLPWVLGSIAIVITLILLNWLL